MPIVPPERIAWRYWNDVQTYTAYNTTVNNYIWNDVWLNNGTTSTGGYLRQDNHWGYWNNEYVARNAYTITTTAVWDGWVGGTGTNAIRWGAGGAGGGNNVVPARRFQPAAVPLVRTEEEWTVIREEQERQRRIRDEAQKEARAEARKLMEVVLTREQLECYLKNNYFEVVGSAGGLFRIYHGTAGNLKQVVDGVEVNALCVHPRLTDYDDDGRHLGYLPTEDSLIAQAFAIMHDELGTVQVANVHRGPRHLAVVREAA